MVKTNVQNSLMKFRPLHSGLVAVLLLSLLIPRPVSGQDLRAFTLQEARNFALQHNYDAQKSQLDVSAAQKRIRETIGAGLPQVNTTIKSEINTKAKDLKADIVLPSKVKVSGKVPSVDDIKTYITESLD